MNATYCELVPARPAPNSRVHPASGPFLGVLEWTLSEDATRLGAHEVEREVKKRMIEVCRLLIQGNLDARGRGDVGRAIEVRDSEAADRVLLFTHRKQADRDLRTEFGLVEARRLAYSQRGQARLCPIDDLLQLPSCSYSYEIQQHLVIESVKGPYQEAVDTLHRYTSQRVSKLTCEEVLKDAATDFDEFYATRTPPDPLKTAEILVGTLDCKGIPMRKPATQVERAGEAKERKKGVKQMATVAVAYTTAPRVRTPEDVVESLFKDPPGLILAPTEAKSVPMRPNKDVRPEHKRVFASLDDGKGGVAKRLAAELAQRDPKSLKIRVAITDGERAVQAVIKEHLATFLLILDLLHVLEKLWKAAGLLVGEGTVHKAEREVWVRTHVLQVLQGHAEEVVRLLRQNTKRFGKRKATVLRNIAGYFERNCERMRYDEFLAAGLPIASGTVEGACKNLVKDRMERSGMRWSWSTEAMLQMRAVYLSGDFDDYWAYHIKAEQRRLHCRSWTAVA